MPTWIVLLRGINVGGHGLLPMKRLVELMESIGCTDVRTYIQSGNVVCTSKITAASTLAQKIGKAILAGQGFEPKIMVLSRRELEAAIANNPYPMDDHKALHLFFLAEPPTPENLARLAPIKHETEQYTLAGKVFYFYAPVAFGTSKIAATFEKVVKVPATARNWRTVMALHDLASPDKVAPDAPAAPRKRAPRRVPTAARATATKHRR